MALAELRKEWKDFESLQTKIESEASSYATKNIETFEAGKSLTKKVAQQRKATVYLKQLLADKSVVGALEPAELTRMKAALSDHEEALDSVQKQLPTAGGWFMRLFLGEVNNIVLSGTTQRRLTFKTEYEQFKYKWTWISMAASLVLLVLVESRALDTLHQLLLTYFYVALAFRENILVANGSNIKAWWIKHHYLSIVVTVTMMTWPYTPAYAAFRPLFLGYAVYAGLLQLLQYKYQMARLYTLKTLGEASVMDTPNTDSAQIIVSRSLAFLMPFIFVGHALQFFNAFFLFRWAYTHSHLPLFGSAAASETVPSWDRHFEWQLYTVALLWAILGYGNLHSTIVVLKNKFSKPAAPAPAVSVAAKNK